MKMSIATLTTMLLGYKSAEKLYSMERIETTKEAVEKLDDILFHAVPYVSDYI
jgi:predicted acetyltransferase